MASTSLVVPSLVVLVHGLMLSPASMRRLEKALRADGYHTLNWGHPSRRNTLGDAVKLLHDTLGAIEKPDMPVHFVGHSLGGLLIRGALCRPLPFRLGRVVMIGTPNQGAGLLARLMENPVIRKALGPTMVDLARNSAALAELGVPDTEIGIIAGTTPFHPINPTSWINRVIHRNVVHDGTVELESTRLDRMADFIELPVEHMFMPASPLVIRQVKHFLKTGRFDHTAVTRIDRRTQPP